MTVFQKALRLITFDVTHTLLKFKLSPGEQYTKVVEKCGGPSVQVEDVSKKFIANYSEMCKKYPNFGKKSDIESWEEWWRHVVRKTICHYITDKQMIEQIATELIESYKMKDYWKLNNGCISILEYLKESGVVLGVISNFDPRLKDILKNTEILPYFDFILPSYEAGYAKPDAKIFQKALEMPMQKLLPSQALHIGDNIELDYLASKKVGWQSAIISNNKNIKHDLINTHHVFNDLNDLKECFKKHKDLFKE